MTEDLPWTPDHELTAEQVRAALGDALRGRAVGPPAFLSEGWDSRAFRADVDGVPWILRFPKRRAVAAVLAREVRVLDVLRPRLPSAVPDARGTFVSASVPYPFSGYPLLPGTQIQHRAADWHAAERVGADLGAFLTALHDVPPAALDGLGVPDLRDVPAVAASRAKGLVALDAVSDSLPRALVRDVRRALSCDVAEPMEHVGVHCDLGDDHVLTDDDGRLTGVIDWADFSFASPHSDLVGGTMAFGDRFLAAALAAYGRPVDGDFAQRVRLSAVSVMIRCVDWGRHAEDPTWTRWNVDRLPLRTAEMLA